MNNQRALCAATQHKLVTNESRAIIFALLSHCPYPEYLSEQVVANILEQAGSMATNYYYGISLYDVWAHWDLLIQTRERADLPLGEVDFVLASACNDVAFEWMTDFLVYAIGKRQAALTSWKKIEAWCGSLLNWGNNSNSGLLDTWASTLQRRRTVLCRDGPFCAITGSYEAVLTQIFPSTINEQKWTSFKAKASIFFGGEYDETLATTNLDSPENAVLLAPEWMSFFDNGQIIMQEMLGEHHIIPLESRLHYDPNFSRVARYDDPYSYGENLKLKFPYRDSVQSTVRLNNRLVEIHGRITSAWAATGLANRLVEEMNWVNNLAHNERNIEHLGEASFSNILRHQLEML